MSGTECVNVLVSNADEYFRYKSDVISEMLLQHLQDLSIHYDSSFADHLRNDGKRLYVCLHQLISNLEPSSNVLWAAVKVFEKCCVNIEENNGILGQKFIAPITELLLRELTHDKKTCVLNILLELTREIVTLEKEPSLPILTSKLTEFIMTEEADIVRLSLMILVNVCHNNVSVVYSLKSCIGGRFFRAIMNLQDDSIATKMQMCKLLFLLEPISLAVDGPPDISRTIIDITFSNLIEAFEKRDVVLLNDIVEFFKELSQFSTYIDLLCSYNRCSDYTQNVLRLMERCDRETVGAIFDFTLALLKVKVPALLPIYPQIVQISLKWLEVENVCVKVLHIITVIVLDMEKDNTVCSDVIPFLDQYLPVFLQLYISSELTENEDCFIVLLKLLQEMFKFEELRNKLIYAINVQRFEELFNQSSSNINDVNQNKNSILLCIAVLSFLSSLSRYDLSYLQLRDKLCCTSEMQKMLCTALYKDQTRIDVLTLINRSALPEECLSGVAKILSGNSSGEILNEQENEENSQSSSFLSFSSFYLSKGSQLDELVKATTQKLDKKEIKTIPVSSVMSLFEYKVAASARTEQTLYTNLETARSYCTEMQEKLMELDARVQQMRDLLLKNQQCAEHLHLEMQELQHIHEIDQINSRKNKKKYVEELSNKEKLCNRKQQECKELQIKLKSLHETKQNLEVNLASILEQLASTASAANDHAAQFSALDQEFKIQDTSYRELLEKHESLEARLKKSKQELAERDAETVNLKKENSAVEREITNLQMLSKAQKKTAEEKDQEIKKLQEQLSDLKRIRDLIANISGGTGKRDD